MKENVQYGRRPTRHPNPHVRGISQVPDLASLLIEAVIDTKRKLVNNKRAIESVEMCKEPVCSSSLLEPRKTMTFNPKWKENSTQIDDESFHNNDFWFEPKQTVDQSSLQYSCQSSRQSPEVSPHLSSHMSSDQSSHHSPLLKKQRSMEVATNEGVVTVSSSSDQSLQPWYPI